MFGNSNAGQHFYNAAIPTPLNACGTTVNVVEPNDVAVCNGMLVDAVTDGVGVDNGTVTDLAMYPKQPFDFAGRTGTISFDVSDDSHGNHRAWPELWVADGPEPAPFTHFSSMPNRAEGRVRNPLRGLRAERRGDRCRFGRRHQQLRVE